jgi:DNA-binding NarL/FixJ family response regulator
VAAAARSEKTIVIADDLRLVLLAVRQELESAGFVVCGEATTGADALEIIRQAHPDLALLDVQMSEGGGDEIAEVLARELPDVKVVLLTAKSDEEGALSAMRSGAVGYLDKTISPSLLAHVLEDVANGEGSYPRRFIPRIAKELRAMAADDAAATAPPSRSRPHKADPSAAAH